MPSLQCLGQQRWRVCWHACHTQLTEPDRLVGAMRLHAQAKQGRSNKVSGEAGSRPASAQQQQRQQQQQQGEADSRPATPAADSSRPSSAGGLGASRVQPVAHVSVSTKPSQWPPLPDACAGSASSTEGHKAGLSHLVFTKPDAALRLPQPSSMPPGACCLTIEMAAPNEAPAVPKEAPAASKGPPAVPAAPRELPTAPNSAGAGGHKLEPSEVCATKRCI